ncbi:hypothetical protein BJ741DRAFT_594888 [Chytriomyces cf. hyalinus JEL632]|nr:hypothetical protein BJ741DRAFT_594888 [Chytriomyces cf. hyalinus JEL632]
MEADQESDLDAAFEATWGPNGLARMPTGHQEPSESPHPTTATPAQTTTRTTTPATATTSHQNQPHANNSNRSSPPTTAQHPGSSSHASAHARVRSGSIVHTSVQSDKKHASLSRPETTATLESQEPTEYLEEHVFPVLLPAIEQMLRIVKRKEGVEEIADPLAWLGQYLQAHKQKVEGGDRFDHSHSLEPSRPISEVQAFSAKHIDDLQQIIPSQ